MDNGGRYIDTRGIPFTQVPEEHKQEIQQYIADGKITPSEAGTSRTSSTLRTTEVDLSHLSESRRQKLAERMYQTRDEWDRSEFSASTVDGGSVARSHKASQVGFGDLRSAPQTRRAPAAPAMTIRGQRAPRNLGSSPLADGFVPAPKAPTATGASAPVPKPPAATSAFLPATATGIGGFVPSFKATTATGGAFVSAPKAPTMTGGSIPGSKAPTAISATTTVVRDPTVNPGRTTTALSPKIAKDASRLGTGSSEQTEEEFKELIDEMVALQQGMSLNEQKQRWMFFNIQKQRKGKEEDNN
ncbi:uncharacterized protein FMAN_15320 [Fusarium mangiferae]|uniref:Uncharacterized protein n=1 Tax=Fusarium mangiferae TaxID=192010 RepID=A0A1L7UHK3_FUSMA|nr:uncharacterized protein FMAN_15320 [Fusarium mangiferae]CVL07197.1 uncharacterized protein FMAN_15320 [Fusarium mangiferae]